MEAAVIESTNSGVFDGTLSAAQAAVMETFVVPRYLSLFGELALELLVASESARIAHLNCRTGYPDRQLAERIDSCEVFGLDSSLAALELARNKAALRTDALLEYLVSDDAFPTELDEGAFSHALTLHPIADFEMRGALFAEMHRLLYPGGQALIALPLRGSFHEIADLFREYALKHDDGDFGRATERSVNARPNIEDLSDQLEAVGFDDVDVEIRQTTLTFDSGRAFAEDPVTRLLIVPELKASLGVEDLETPLDYLRDAIDKYWSEDQFDLNLNVGCASARKP